MFSHKRRRDVLQETCLSSHNCSTQNGDYQPGKRVCHGVDSLNSTSREMEVSEYETHSSVSDVHDVPSIIPDRCIVPVSPRKCKRCAAGEPGHINHILG